MQTLVVRGRGQAAPAPLFLPYQPCLKLITGGRVTITLPSPPAPSVPSPPPPPGIAIDPLGVPATLPYPPPPPPPPAVDELKKGQAGVEAPAPALEPQPAAPAKPPAVAGVTGDMTSPPAPAAPPHPPAAAPGGAPHGVPGGPAAVVGVIAPSGDGPPTRVPLRDPGRERESDRERPCADDDGDAVSRAKEGGAAAKERRDAKAVASPLLRLLPSPLPPRPLGGVEVAEASPLPCCDCC